MMVLRILGILAFGAGSFQDSRLPVPGAAEQKETEKLVRSLFKEEYAKRSAADRQALARKLLQQAKEAKDSPVHCYVLLRESADLAAEANDLAGSFRALEEMAASYQLDSLKLRLAALATASKTARTPDESAALTGFYLRIVDEALATEDFETARKASDPAGALARKAKDVSLIMKVQAKDKEVADLKSKSEKVKKARETLAAKPDDPASCLVVGQFECFQKGNWKEGLPLLAQGVDGPLKDLATRDLAGPAEAAQQVAVGDGWWDLSEKETVAAVRQRLRLRAYSWYEKAAGSIIGLNKAKVDKRLKTLKTEMLHRGTWVDLGDPKMFGKSGKPGDPITLSQDSIHSGRLPGEFDGLFVRIRIKSGSVTVAYEPRKCGSWIQTVNPHMMTGRYNATAGRWEPENQQIIPVFLEEEYPITVLIENGEYVVYLHAEVKGRLATTATTISSFELDTFNGSVVVDQIRVRRKE